MEEALKKRGVKKFRNFKKLIKLIKFRSCNAMLHRYKIKHFKGTNFHGIDFLLLLGDVFAQVLIFIYFTPTVTVTGIFLINVTPSVRWRLLQEGV